MPLTPAVGVRPGARRHAVRHAVRRAALTVCVTLTLVAATTTTAATTTAATAATTTVAVLAPTLSGRDRLHEPGIVTDLTEGTPAPPELPAASYVLADLTSGDVLVAKAAHTTRGPASTLKLLTAQTLAPLIADDTVIRAATSDAAVDGTRVGMVPAVDYTAGQLFSAMVMQSANDASEALARSNGSLEESVRRMNERAAQLGATDTVARTPHGLDAPGQQSSAYDLVTILRGALATPKVARILTVQTATFPGGGKAPFQIASQNKLLWNYDGAIGGKDGFTDAAGHTYVGAVRRGESVYAVAFMGAASNDWRPTSKLLDWAFAHGSGARALGALPPPAPPIAEGPGGERVGAVAETDVHAVAPVAAVKQEPGTLGRPFDGLLTLLTALLWTLPVLGIAVATLRVRKLRRDARRREERRAYRAATTNVAPSCEGFPPDSEGRRQDTGAHHDDALFDPVAPRVPRGAVPRQPATSPARSKERTGLQRPSSPRTYNESAVTSNAKR